MEERRKVIVISKHSLFREGLSRVLGESEEYSVVGAASSVVEAVGLAGSSPPDVVVVDGSEEKADEESLAALFGRAPERVVRLSLADSDMTVISRKRIARATVQDFLRAVREAED